MIPLSTRSALFILAHPALTRGYHWSNSLGSPSWWIPEETKLRKTECSKAGDSSEVWTLYFILKSCLCCRNFMRLFETWWLAALERCITINYFLNPGWNQGSISNSFISVKCSGVMALVLAYKSRFTSLPNFCSVAGISHCRRIGHLRIETGHKSELLFLSKEPFYLHTTEGRYYFPISQSQKI